ncbi:hypothetical protein P7F88_02365 [Vibrio hannami]|uniref:c-type cytochrome n=1 Tax=Vibrio hannami TaxID=2717094 RepID=UPI002410B262|nr:hypothetical protein [Vibrio hannami]MDG3084995.1 hypothetical protein [Vibrio hannami]
MPYFKVYIALAALTFSNISGAESPLSFSQGEELFRTAGGYGCSTCHGLFATGSGNVGGNIRGKTLKEINTVLDTEPTMKLLSEALDEQDRQLLALYLGDLGGIPSIEWVIEDKPTTLTVSIEQGKESELVVFNKVLQTLSLSLPNISTDPLTINPYETKAIRWVPEIGQIQLSYQQNILDIEIK